MLNICSCPLVVSLQRRIENKRLQQSALEVLLQIATKWPATLRAHNVASELPREEKQRIWLVHPKKDFALYVERRLSRICGRKAVEESDSYFADKETRFSVK